MLKLKFKMIGIKLTYSQLTLNNIYQLMHLELSVFFLVFCFDTNC